MLIVAQYVNDSGRAGVTGLFVDLVEALRRSLERVGGFSLRE
jgi:hypothetical protein